MSDTIDVPEREGSRRLSRREAIQVAGIALTGLAAAAAGSAWYLRFVAPRALDVTLLDVRLPNLPWAMDGLRIAHMSDLHASEIVKPDWIRNAVDVANEYQPDLACLTGDFVYRSAGWATACAQELSRLEAPGGRFAVLGNHDVWNGADAVAGALQTAGIHVLRNQGLKVRVRETDAWIIGVEDTGLGCLGGAGDWEDLREAFAPARQAADSVLAVIPAGVPSLLLVHNPDFMQLMAEHPVALALAGHTHGGQVVLPGVGPLVLPSCFGRTYARGLVQSPGGPVYVNRGVGLIEPAVRLNCPPEVAVITLRRE
jgi:predicted MPP superfamily phosphohydrolase